MQTNKQATDQTSEQHAWRASSRLRTEREGNSRKRKKKRVREKEQVAAISPERSSRTPVYDAARARVPEWSHDVFTLATRNRRRYPVVHRYPSILAWSTYGDLKFSVSTWDSRLPLVRPLLSLRRPWKSHPGEPPGPRDRPRGRGEYLARMISNCSDRSLLVVDDSSRLKRGFRERRGRRCRSCQRR